MTKKTCSILDCTATGTKLTMTRYYNGLPVCDKHTYEIDTGLQIREDIAMALMLKRAKTKSKGIRNTRALLG